MANKDNTSLDQKVALRLSLLHHLADPVVLETHGGLGRVYLRCYSDVVQGVVIEKNAAKCEALAHQRPTWSVYEADCVKALAAGAAAHLPVNMLDVDPYGACWDAVGAFFASDRPWPWRIGVAVNCGLRQSLSTNTGWKCAAMTPALTRWPNHRLHTDYLDVCRFLLAHHSAPRGYEIRQWHGYYCGHLQQMTHFAAIIERS